MSAGSDGATKVALPAGQRPLAPHEVRLAHARATISRVRSGRATFHRVALELGLDPEQLPVGREERALAIYRAYLGDAVTTVSPLLLRVCDLNGMSLDGLVQQLCPAMFWDQWLCGVRPGDAWLRSLTGLANARDVTDELRQEWGLQEWLHGGRPVYGPTGHHIVFGIRVLEAGLEMAAFPGGHRLRTHGAEGSLTLRMALPDTVMAALPGVALDRLVDHPLLNGAGCVVTAVDEPTLRWGTKVRFALEPAPWRMPWAR